MLMQSLSASALLTVTLAKAGVQSGRSRCLSFLKTSSAAGILALRSAAPYLIVMHAVVFLLLLIILRTVGPGSTALQLENLALRQQLALLKGKKARPRLRPLD